MLYSLDYLISSLSILFSESVFLCLTVPLHYILSNAPPRRSLSPTLLSSALKMILDLHNANLKSRTLFKSSFELLIYDTLWGIGESSSFPESYHERFWDFLWLRVFVVVDWLVGFFSLIKTNWKFNLSTIYTQWVLIFFIRCSCAIWHLDLLSWQ